MSLLQNLIQNRVLIDQLIVKTSVCATTRHFSFNFFGEQNRNESSAAASGNDVFLDPTQVSSLSKNSKDKKTQSPLQKYKELVTLGKVTDDPYQKKIISSLESLHYKLCSYKPPVLLEPSKSSSLFDTGFLSKVFQPFNTVHNESIDGFEYTDKIPKGLYLWGDVGCGKSFLLDLFYDCIPSNLTKKRLHFHQFMQHVHKRSHEIMNEQSRNKKLAHDPVPFIAYELAKEARVLCFDEFQVTDVADAMILRRLLSQLLSDKYGVILFATSNRKPHDLYINGVQRDSFIPCIDLLCEKSEIVLLDSPTDYRKVAKPVSSVYYHPPSGVDFSSKICLQKREEHITKWYKYFAQTDDPKIETHTNLTVWGRHLNIPKCTSPYVAQFTFKELCGGNLAAGDYLQLAKEYEAFIVTDIPYLTVFKRDEVRRFITFLDACYENKCKLASTSAARFTDLFVEPELLIDDYHMDYTKKEDSLPGEVVAKNNDDINIDAEIDLLVKEHGFSKEIAEKSKLFALDEERFAFARALSRLTQMTTSEWVDAVSRR
ncbi:hypothetical protein QEN19_001630 [Hanseniaspora menglaensis]